MPATATINTRGIQGESLSAASDRLVNTVLLAEGVVDKAGNSFQVLQNLGTDMNVKVGSGTAYDRAVVKGDSAGQGTFVVEHQNASQVLAVAAADATLARKDIVILRVYDDTFDSSGNDYSDVEVVTGTPNASPVEPALPSGAIKLAVVDVGAAVTQIVNGNITDSRIAVVLNSGIASGSMLRMERATSAQSIPNNTVTVVVFNSTIFEVDDTGRLTPNTGTGVVTVNEAGIYRVTAGISFVLNTTGQRILDIYVDGTAKSRKQGDTSSVGSWAENVSTLVKLAATNTIDVRVSQTSGSALDLSIGSVMYLTVEWVGPS